MGVGVALATLGGAYGLGCSSVDDPGVDAGHGGTHDGGQDATVSDGGSGDGGHEGHDGGHGMDAGSATHAMATLVGEDGGPSGTVTFDEVDDGGAVRVQAQVMGVTPPGPHGMHLHQTGQCDHAGGHQSAGGHWNPDDAGHACPPATPRHAGDLGNITVDDGGAGTLDITVSGLTVRSGPRTVVGHAVILHGGTDDCASQPAGDAGPRVGCAVIVVP